MDGHRVDGIRGAAEEKGQRRRLSGEREEKEEWKRAAGGN